MFATRLLVPLLLLTSGCYFYFRPPDNRARPSRAATGTQIELTSEEKTERTRCSDRDTRESCKYENGVRRITSHFTEYTAMYDGKQLTEGELRALVDPGYNSNWDTIERKSRVCKVSLIPTVLAGVGLAVSTGALFYGRGILGDAMRETDTTKAVMYAGGGAAIGFGLLSYPLGGYACVSANLMGIRLGTKYHDTREIRVGYRYAHPTEAEMTELEQLVEAFNAKVGGPRPTDDSEPSERAPTTSPSAPSEPPAPGDEPPPSDGFVPGKRSIMKTLADAGEFKEFSAMIVEVGVDREIATGGPYTVIAPTDAKIAKIKDKSFRKDKALLARSVRDLILIGVVSSGQHTLPTLAGTTATLDLKKDGRLKRKQAGSSYLLGPATNGVIYRQE